MAHRLHVFLMLMVLIFAVIACQNNGDSNEDTDPPVQTPIAEDIAEGEPEPGTDPLEIANSGSSILNTAPLPVGFRTFDDISIVERGLLELDTEVRVSVVLRNDSTETLSSIDLIITLLDQDGIRLETFTTRSGQGNIAPGGSIAMTSVHDITGFPDYAGSNILIQESRANVAEVNASAVLGEDTSAIIQTDMDLVNGTTRNATERPLLTPIAHFLLYDENDDLLAIVAGVIVAGLDNQNVWRPGSTLTIESRLPNTGDMIPARAELRVVAYDYPAFNG